MESAAVKLAGDGLAVGKSDAHPAGTLFSGGYDAQRNTVYLAGVMGHPRGVNLAGGDPSSEHVAGLRVIIAGAAIYWATDSMSKPRGLSEAESAAVQTGLEQHFPGQPVRRVEKLQDAAK
jgi:hypothetical protein